MSKTRKMADKAVARVVNYKDFFKTRKGQAILYDLCKHSQFFTTIKDDSLHFVEGQRDIVRFILAQTNTNPSKLVKLFEDRLQEERDEFEEFGE